MKLLERLFGSKDVAVSGEEMFAMEQKLAVPVKTYTKPSEKDLTKELIAQIHNEFYTAGDTLLAQANVVLAKEQTKEVNKGARLATLGFGNTREAIISKEEIAKREEAERQMKIVTEYAVKYPNNKFITQEVVDRICKKYNLVFGNCSSYKGFVPEKNLQEIEAFKVREEDQMILVRSRFGSWGGSLSTEPKISFRPHEYNSNQGNAPLKIAAPLKDMFVRQDEEVVGHNIVKKHIPDPVVLCPVPNGFIIVTMWGDESHDPELNTLNN